MIYINKGQILNLQSDLAAYLENQDSYVSDGGIIRGELNVSGALTANNDIYISGEKFLVYLNEDQSRIDIYPDRNDNTELSSYLRVSNTSSEKSDIILEFGQSVSIDLNSNKIIYNGTVLTISGGRSINLGTGEMTIDSSGVTLSANYNINGVLERDYDEVFYLNTHENIIDSINLNTIYKKDYELFLYSVDAGAAVRVTAGEGIFLCKTGLLSRSLSNITIETGLDGDFLNLIMKNNSYATSTGIVRVLGNMREYLQ